MKIVELKWKKWHSNDDDGNPRFYAETTFGVTYHVSKIGWWFPLWELNECKDLEEAKLKAQEDFKKKVKNCVI